MEDPAACQPLPSSKYPELELPRRLLLHHACEAPQSSSCPVSMRRPPAAAAKNTGGLTGPGAGKVGTLLGASGCRYVGQVLAGQPHGRGSCFVACDTPGQRERLDYEGDWVKGVRHGRGSCHFSNGEAYEGNWARNRRHGTGKLTYADGSVYEGAWASDKRHGTGSFTSAGGSSIFVGSFVRDQRQGLGVTYWPARGVKYVAEYADDMPVAGAFYQLGDDAAEAPTPQLRAAIAAAALAAAAGGSGDQQRPTLLPVLQLSQPSQVLLQQFVTVRQAAERKAGGSTERKAGGSKQQQQAAATAAGGASLGSCSTLPAETVNLLRHAFILLAGGDGRDGRAAAVQCSQLTELVVLAGLDPAAPPVVKLLAELAAACDGGGGSGDVRALELDDFLHIVLHFRPAPQQLAPLVGDDADAFAEGGGGEQWAPASDVAADIVMAVA